MENCVSKMCLFIRQSSSSDSRHLDQISARAYVGATFARYSALSLYNYVQFARKENDELRPINSKTFTVYL